MHQHPPSGPSASPTPHDTPSQGHSLREIKLASGLTLHQIADRTGLHYRRVGRITSERCRPRRREAVLLRRCLGDELRLRRSSDPGFLSAIRRVAAPFLAGRLRATR